jgi:hypothetical protein
MWVGWTRHTPASPDRHAAVTSLPSRSRRFSQMVILQTVKDWPPISPPTTHHPPPTTHSPQSAVRSPQSAVRSPPFAVRRPPFAVRRSPSAGLARLSLRSQSRARGRRASRAPSDADQGSAALESHSRPRRIDDATAVRSSQLQFAVAVRCAVIHHRSPSFR